MNLMKKSKGLKRVHARLRFYTVIIGTFIAAQAFTALIYHPQYSGAALFPFFDYPMYRQAHLPGEEMPDYRLTGVAVDGELLEISAEDMGLDLWKFRNGPLKALRGSAVDYEKLGLYADIFRQKQDKQIAYFRLENHPRILSREGSREGDPRVVRVAQVEGLKGKVRIL